MEHLREYIAGLQDELEWDIRQVVRAVKARIFVACQRKTVWKRVGSNRLSMIHPVAGMTGVSVQDTMRVSLFLAA